MTMQRHYQCLCLQILILDSKSEIGKIGIEAAVGRFFISLEVYKILK